jgi:hypothetical protein
MNYDMMAPDGHTFYHCLGSVSSWLLRHDFHHLLLQMPSIWPNTGLDGNGPSNFRGESGHDIHVSTYGHVMAHVKPSSCGL